MTCGLAIGHPRLPEHVLEQMLSVILAIVVGEFVQQHGLFFARYVDGDGLCWLYNLQVRST